MSDDEAEYNVEKILDKRRNREGGIEYLIKVRPRALPVQNEICCQWENYPMEESTWESEANASCPELIAEFERERKKKVSMKTVVSVPACFR